MQEKVEVVPFRSVKALWKAPRVGTGITEFWYADLACMVVCVTLESRTGRLIESLCAYK